MAIPGRFPASFTATVGKRPAPVQPPSNMPAAYDQLVAKLKRAHTLGTVADLLGWDEQVNLPADSADVRAGQHAVMAETQHAAATDLGR